MVVRMATGGYIRGGPFTRSCPESLYIHTPGWYVALSVERGRTRRA
jgi:pyruvate/2-oxoglutarate/acetoin dehydrogenase E1 component